MAAFPTFGVETESRAHKHAAADWLVAALARIDLCDAARRAQARDRRQPMEPKPSRDLYEDSQGKKRHKRSKDGRGGSTRRGDGDSPDASPPRRDVAAQRQDSRNAMEAHAMPPASANLSQPVQQTRIITTEAMIGAPAQSSTVGQPLLSAANALGAGTDTIYRDRNGHKVDLQQLQQQQQQQQETRKPSTPIWGTGLAQQKSQAAGRERKRGDGMAPLARYEIDSSVDREKRAAVRFDDPMAEHLAARKGATAARNPSHRGPTPPNRFGIPPGLRWDGVDRSNGYEEQFFLVQVLGRSRAQEAHARATQDM